MSLINEALKKAQKQRSEDAATQSGTIPPPGVGGLGASPPAPPRPPKAPAAGGAYDEGAFARPDPLIAARARKRQAGLGRFAMPVAVLAVAIVLGVWWSGRPTDPEPVSTPTSVAVGATVARDRADTPATAATSGLDGATGAGPDASQSAGNDRITFPTQTEVLEPPPSPPASSGSAASAQNDREASIPVSPRPEPAPVIAFVSPTANDASAAPAPVMTGPTESTLVRELPARAVGGGLTILTDDESQVSARVAGDAGRAASPSEAILRYLERAKVTGVRVSANDPKVLMNDRVYRLNDVVDRDLQLRVISIDSRELSFRDAQGYVYTKAF